ncbi:DMT family transporter [Motiliproteus sp. SC1-56]|uniref:DMT family transporter n=1 Tax=Motiliproteus sp. SC1-56 TaxID=2799565 RepID=UPI001A907A82|nr:DMT family transporter [Motiliproteus sp. SC1-56]
MPVPAAYLIVVLVWSTTPLAIVWSSEAVSPIMAALLRMALAAMVGQVLLWAWRIPLPLDRQALRGYGWAILGIYGAMATTYVASRHVPSGLISLIFGLAPIVSGLLGRLWLNERGFTPVRWLALLLAVIGLARIMSDNLLLDPGAYGGIALMLLAVTLFSASAVLVKGTGSQIHPLAQTVGALWGSLPCYLLTWWLLEGQWPDLAASGRSLWAILYLALFGSLLGFVCYFYVLKRLSPGTVALVTLITPAIALLLGNLLNDEAITPRLLQGGVMICLGLGLYHWGDRLRHRLRPARP